MSSSLSDQMHTFYQSLKGQINPTTGQKYTPSERGALWRQERARREAHSGIMTPVSATAPLLIDNYSRQMHEYYKTLKGTKLSPSQRAALWKQERARRNLVDIPAHLVHAYGEPPRKNPVSKLMHLYLQTVNPTTGRHFTRHEASTMMRQAGIHTRAGAIAYLRANGQDVSMYE